MRKHLEPDVEVFASSHPSPMSVHRTASGRTGFPRLGPLWQGRSLVREPLRRAHRLDDRRLSSSNKILPALVPQYRKHVARADNPRDGLREAALGESFRRL